MSRPQGIDAQTPLPTADQYDAARARAASNQRRHAKSTVRWVAGAVVTHLIFPHAAIVNDVVQIAALVRGGQTAIDTVDKHSYDSEAARVRAIEERAVANYRRTQAPNS